MEKDFLLYGRPTIEEDEIMEVVNTLRSGWITMGPRTQEFEKQIAQYTGARNAIAVNSCTAALHLSLVCLDIGKSDEVITTPFTFAATGNVIINVGAKPVFVDVKKDTFNINPEEIEKSITPQTKAIIPVHYGGQACDIKAILDIAQDHNLFVIEDAAHAIGAEYEGKRIGTFGNTTCFSFYPTKNMTTGEGGAITTENDELAERLRILRIHGISRDAWSRYSEKGNWHYEIEEAGWNYSMNDLQAALGIHQIIKLNKFIEIRRKYACRYNECLGGLDELITPFEMPNVKHVYNLYPLLIKNYNRDSFIKEMHARRIICSVHFIPLHLHPFYQRIGFKKGDFPNAEWIYKREVSLPLYPLMTQEDVESVVSAIRDIFHK